MDFMELAKNRYSERFFDPRPVEQEKLGIHNVWLRGFDARTVSEVFELPANIIPVMMFAMGYPSEKAKPNAWHFKRMPMEEFVTEL